eukprot:6195750-Pleurochrysis_carterae.AAC.3
MGLVPAESATTTLPPSYRIASILSRRFGHKSKRATFIISRSSPSPRLEPSSRARAFGRSPYPEYTLYLQATVTYLSSHGAPTLVLPVTADRDGRPTVSGDATFTPDGIEGRELKAPTAISTPGDAPAEWSHPRDAHTKSSNAEDELTEESMPEDPLAELTALSCVEEQVQAELGCAEERAVSQSSSSSEPIAADRNSRTAAACAAKSAASNSSKASGSLTASKRRTSTAVPAAFGATSEIELSTATHPAKSSAGSFLCSQEREAAMDGAGGISTAAALGISSAVRGAVCHSSTVRGAASVSSAVAAVPLINENDISPGAETRRTTELGQPSVISACLSFPVVGKHLCFDGRMLHGARSPVCPRFLCPNVPCSLTSHSHVFRSLRRAPFLVSFWRRHSVLPAALCVQWPCNLIALWGGCFFWRGEECGASGHQRKTKVEVPAALARR